jgi:hypothetical protein
MRDVGDSFGDDGDQPVQAVLQLVMRAVSGLTGKSSKDESVIAHHCDTRKVMSPDRAS